jgi:hypothetical protein
MPVQITINQAGASAGSPGVAREDLATGTPVNLAAGGGAYSSYLWELVDVAVDYIAMVRSTAGLSAPSAASTDVLPVDLAGTYLVRVSVDSGSGLGATADDVAELTFYAGPALAPVANQMPRRVPAFGEALHHNVPQDPGLGSANNQRGWAAERARWDAVLARHEALLAASALEWYVEDQLVASDGQTVFPTGWAIADTTNVQFVINGLVVPTGEYYVSGPNQVTYAPGSDSPSTVAGWDVQIRYLKGASLPT